MDVLKKIFPLAFSVKEKDSNAFVIQLIIAIVALVVVGVVLGILAAIVPFLFALGLFALVGSLVELYVIADIVFCILRFTGVFKD